MIRLALAVGFMAVFGLVAYAIVMLLVEKFKNNQNEKQKTKNKPNNEN